MKHLEPEIVWNRWRSGVEDLWRILFPRYCVHCHDLVADDEALCGHCRLGLSSALPLKQAEDILMDIFDGSLVLQNALSLFLFRNEASIQSLLHALKYKGRLDVGRMFGLLLADRLMERKVRPDIILPVPIHPKKKKIRGYNQAEVIARAMGERMCVPVCEGLLRREVHSESNTHLGRWARWDNVSHNFSWKGGITGRHYLLVDDVLTTGATIQACVEKAKMVDPDSRWSIATAAVVWRD